MSVCHVAGIWGYNCQNLRWGLRHPGLWELGPETAGTSLLRAMRGSRGPGEVGASHVPGVLPFIRAPKPLVPRNGCEMWSVGTGHLAALVSRGRRPSEGVAPAVSFAGPGRHCRRPP